MFVIAYIGIGSNVGDREGQINEAVRILSDRDDIEVLQVSGLLENPAVSDVPHPDFLNAAAELSTFLSAEELLGVLETIETDFGRQSKGLGEPRTLDLDLLFYGTEVICSEELTVPHPLLHDRYFVLKPMMDIAPDFVHPLIGMSVRELLEESAGI